MSKDFGNNLIWFLSDVANADADQIESSKIDIYGETEQGADTYCEVDLRELCGAAAERIEKLQVVLQRYAKYGNKEVMERDIRLLTDGS